MRDPPVARYKADQKQISREEILKRAAERFRQDGVGHQRADAHGGFYAHFASREDLIAAAIEYAAESTLDYFREVLAATPEPERLKVLIKTYLRPLHRDHMGLGCAVSALGPEIARQSEETRRRFDVRGRGMVRLIADHLPPGGAPEDRLDRASLVFAQMFGTLQLVRIETDPDVAQRLLQGGRAAALLLATQPWPQAG